MLDKHQVKKEKPHCSHGAAWRTTLTGKALAEYYGSVAFLSAEKRPAADQKIL
jgi:hypothetical protein